MTTFHGQVRRAIADVLLRRRCVARRMPLCMRRVYGGGWPCGRARRAMVGWAEAGEGRSVRPIAWAGRTVRETVRGGVAAGQEGRRVAHAAPSR